MTKSKKKVIKDRVVYCTMCRRFEAIPQASVTLKAEIKYPDNKESGLIINTDKLQECIRDIQITQFLRMCKHNPSNYILLNRETIDGIQYFQKFSVDPKSYRYFYLGLVFGTAYTWHDDNGLKIVTVTNNHHLVKAIKSLKSKVIYCSDMSFDKEINEDTSIITAEVYNHEFSCFGIDRGEDAFAKLINQIKSRMKGK